MPRLRLNAALIAATLLLLSGCGQFPARDWGPAKSMDTSGIPDPVPHAEPRSPYGNKPYKVAGVTYNVLDDASGYVERGLASWYGRKFHGQLTSSHEVYDMYGMTAAHRTLPLPTYVRVTNLQNGRSCIVRVNDRGPFHDDRLIDLSYAAASKLGIVETGTAMVEVRAIDTGIAKGEPKSGAPVVTAKRDFGEALVAEPIGNSVPALPRVKRPPEKRLYVQVGAFANQENAERLRDRLKREQNLSTTIQPAGAQGKTLFRLRVGPLTSAWDAQHVVRQLNGLGIGTPKIVRDTPMAENAPPL